MAVTLFVLVTVTFFVSQLLPGTPFADYRLTDQARARLFARYGLDQPLIVQYGKYLLDVVQGDFGNSYYPRSRREMA